MPVKVMIPYNFTENDEKALDFVIARYLDDKTVKLTLFHAHHPIREVNVVNNPIMDKMNRTTSYLRQVLSRKKEELEETRQLLVSKGFRSENIDCLFAPLKTDLATDIIRLIKTQNYNAVVLNRSPDTIINFFSKHISEKIFNNLTTGVSIHIVN